MMQLSRISLIQWHLFGRADLDLEGDGAILGRNRSGKSTLIDLIQVVLTGGSASFFKLNSSAGEGGRRSDRTLRGYCLGQIGVDSFLRNQGITHIALVFEDEARQRRPVTVGLCIETPPGEDAHVVGRYVADGFAASSEDFVEQIDNQAASAPWSVVRARLETACQAGGGSLICSSRPIGHVRELMRLLFTHRRSPDADRFARAFVLALSFEEIRSVQEFVRNHLLARNDIDIGELRASIQRYRQIQREIHELHRRLEAVRVLQIEVERFVDLRTRVDISAGVNRLAELVESTAALYTQLRDLKTAQAGLISTTDEISRYDDEIKAAEDELTSLQNQLAMNSQAGQRGYIESEIKFFRRERDGYLARVQVRFLAAARACGLLRMRERLPPLKLGQVLNALEQIKTESADLSPPDWPRNPVSIETALAQAAHAATERRASVAEQRNEAIRQVAESLERTKDLGRRLSAARDGRTNLDPKTEDLIAALRAAGMQPRALCEVTEVVDEDWRLAAEALLGRSRETILVAPEHAAKAIEMLRSGRGLYGQSRVANTRRLATAPRTAADGTLNSVMRSHDELALAYLVFRFGSVRLATDQADLLSGGRAILKDGAHYNGIEVEMLKAYGGFKIGKSAAGLMLEELQTDLKDEQQILSRHEDHVRHLEEVLARLDELCAPVAADDDLSKLTDLVTRCDDELASRHARLAEIAATVDPQLQLAMDEAKSRVRLSREEKDILLTEAGSLSSDIKARQTRLDGGESELGSRWHCRNKRRRFRAQVTGPADFALVRAAYEQRRKGQTPARIAAQALKDVERLSEELKVCDNAIRDGLTNYRYNFDSAAPTPGAANIVSEVRPWVQANVERLESNELLAYRQQADAAALQVVSLFRSAFVHELNSRFSALEDELDLINTALQARPLHNEVYRIRAEVRDDLKGLHHLARESETDDATLTALLLNGEASDSRHAGALSFIERLLQDETLDVAEYQDYRNYYLYDLRSRDVRSGHEHSFERRRGTASGAERQVPFYVVIGAALSSIYHGTRRNAPRSELGMGLAVFDEAFSKMDGPNQRTLLEFYQEIGLQIVIAAPTEKRAAVMENLDWVADVYRVDNAAAVKCGYVKAKAREAMRQANPEHLSEEDLRALLAKADEPVA